ncbi:DNA-protecting protein DprA [Formicincola oecophyllae]|uniref:DNA-protecting protein DprA n=1 Tax=Formicincola oecophyllae TaxID=2558361 RepID=A0A4Y6UB74_9PROT|nr:DNA-processing protein DprA [Formicincola oecophyllae]QDH13716.1 DNA-protecting protein DprA [Formicincola oecophyllae]
MAGQGTGNVSPHWLARYRLGRSQGVGPRTYQRLLAKFPNPEEALQALPRLAAKAKRPCAVQSVDQALEEISATDNLGGEIILHGDQAYPPLLAQLPDPPPLLFTKGWPGLLSQKGIGIVGARHASAAGLRVVAEMASMLASQGYSVVSGLARGIDGAAHKAALAHGLTIAAVAGGLDQPYPPQHASLHEDIAHHGCLVTEMPPGTLPRAQLFPRRNRLIAGLTLGTVIVEGALRSGTLITARLALSYDRVVMAVPGHPLDLRSGGGNQLIKDGAALVCNGQDVLEAVCLLPGLKTPPQGPRSGHGQRPTMTHSRGEADLFSLQTNAPANAVQHPRPERGLQQTDADKGGELRAAVLELLSDVPASPDTLAASCGCPIGALMALLGELELSGLAVNTGAGFTRA